MQGNSLLLVLVLWPMVGALIGYLIGRKNKSARDYFADFVGVSEFILAVYLFWQVSHNGDQTLSIANICDQGLYFKLDGFRILYACIAALMWMMTTIFSREYLHHYRNRNRYYLFTLITGGATMGVFLSADLFTTFIFFEIMSFTSYVMVIHDEKPGAMRAGQTYVAVAILGGMVMLMGLFMLYNVLGTLQMDEIYEACGHLEDKANLYLPSILILFGFGAKAGMFPLHIWLPKAHPVAPAPASALLSGILTKAGVFGILVVSSNIFLHDPVWGNMILMLGVITMFLGAFIAVFSIDFKRTLACSSMSQIGFIMVGIGMQGLLGHHNALAVWGTLLHMVNHSMIKLDLFMVAGVIYMHLHKLDLNDIRGFGRGKPFAMLCFLMGYLGIIGMPFWNGYVSKTLLHESIVEFIAELVEHGAAYAVYYKAIEWIFLISGGLTAAYMTKLFVAVFIEKNATKQEKMDALNGKYISKASMFAIGITSILLPIMGAVPEFVMTKMAAFGQHFMYGHEPAHAVHFYAWVNLKGAVISLAIGAIVYFGFIRTVLMRRDENGVKVYVDLWPAKLDLENLIYRPMVSLLTFIGALIGRLVVTISGIAEKAVPVVGAMIARLFCAIPNWIASPFGGVLKAFRIPDPDSWDLEPGELIPEQKAESVSKDITEQLSYGLMSFGVGFCAVMIYLLVELVF